MGRGGRVGRVGRRCCGGRGGPRRIENSRTESGAERRTCEPTSDLHPFPIAPPNAARRNNAFQPRGKRSVSRVRVRGRLFARRMQERRAQDRAVRRGWFNSEAGKMLRLTSPLASRFTAASLGLLDEVLFNAEEQRSGDLEGERGERMGEICSADFIKCAGKGKPHFIKCGFDSMEPVPIGCGCFC